MGKWCKAVAMPEVSWNPEGVAAALKRLKSSNPAPTNVTVSEDKCEQNFRCYDATTTYALYPPLQSEDLKFRLKKIELKDVLRTDACRIRSFGPPASCLEIAPSSPFPRFYTMSFDVEVLGVSCHLAIGRMQNENEVGNDWDFEEGFGGFFADEYSCPQVVPADQVVQGIKAMLGLQ
jgi:hypothetical protein